MMSAGRCSIVVESEVSSVKSDWGCPGWVLPGRGGGLGPHRGSRGPSSVLLNWTFMFMMALWCGFEVSSSFGHSRLDLKVSVVVFGFLHFSAAVPCSNQEAEAPAPPTAKPPDPSIES